MPMTTVIFGIILLVAAIVVTAFIIKAFVKILPLLIILGVIMLVGRFFLKKKIKLG